MNRELMYVIESHVGGKSLYLSVLSVLSVLFALSILLVVFQNERKVGLVMK